MDHSHAWENPTPSAEQRKEMSEERGDNNHTYSKEDRAVRLPPPGHGVTGDGTNDAHRISLCQECSFFFFGRRWSVVQCGSREPASKALWTGSSHELIHTAHSFHPAATFLSNHFPCEVLELSNRVLVRHRCFRKEVRDFLDMFCSGHTVYCTSIHIPKNT